MFYLLIVCCLFVSGSVGISGPRGTYSNQWLMRTDMSLNNVRAVTAPSGLRVVAEPFSGYYVLQKDDVQTGSNSAAPISQFSQYITRIPNVEFKQLRYHNHSMRTSLKRAVSKGTFNITDSQWSDMWHVESSQFPSMGVYNAWSDGYAGIGVHVAVLDNGVEPTHTDLQENYDESQSFDYLENSTYVNQTGLENHGTLCAGLISATKNDDCVLGTAYQSTFSAVKIFNNVFGLNDLGESLALIHSLGTTDIYSNSWGPADSGSVFGGPGQLAIQALIYGTTEGRGGKGAIYTWANGNGGVEDDCNCDGYANSIYTISVTSVGRDQAPAFYSEQCSGVMAATYSGDSPDLMIASTAPNDGCTTGFQGTSASCPIAAGIIALVLEANAELTWRDVQHLIVETSETNGLISPNWQTNGAGTMVSHNYGFGLMNADTLIRRASMWTNVPQQVTCTGPLVTVNRTSDNGVSITSGYTSDGCSGRIGSIEHAQVWVSFNSTYRGRIAITLVSPEGTLSRLLKSRRFDTYSGNLEWTYMTLFNWGENPNGEWTLHLETTDSSIVYTLTSWRLTLYGTESRVSSTGAQISEEPISDDSSSTTGAIVGGVIGGVLATVIIVGGVYVVIKKLKPKDPTVYPTNQDMPANTSLGVHNTSMGTSLGVHNTSMGVQNELGVHNTSMGVQNELGVHNTSMGVQNVGVHNTSMGVQNVGVHNTSMGVQNVEVHNTSMGVQNELGVHNTSMGTSLGVHNTSMGVQNEGFQQ